MELEHDQVDVMLPDEVVRVAERYQKSKNLPTVEAALVELIWKGLNDGSTEGVSKYTH